MQPLNAEPELNLSPMLERVLAKHLFGIDLNN